jgi:hypothetical protein
VTTPPSDTHEALIAEVRRVAVEVARASVGTFGAEGEVLSAEDEMAAFRELLERYADGHKPAANHLTPARRRAPTRMRQPRYLPAYRGLACPEGQRAGAGRRPAGHRLAR